VVEVGLRDYVDGAALVSDLVNTVPGHRLGDRLTSAQELTAFLAAHDLAHDRVTGRDVTAVRTLRGELVALFTLGTDAEVLSSVSEILEPCPHRLVVGPDHASAKHGDWRLATTPDASYIDQLRLVAGTSLLAVIQALGRERLRDCSSPDCTGMFIDTSNTGRRRFCIPRICGNRLNVARYRAKQAGLRSPADPRV